MQEEGKFPHLASTETEAGIPIDTVFFLNYKDYAGKLVWGEAVKPDSQLLFRYRLAATVCIFFAIAFIVGINIAANRLVSEKSTSTSAVASSRNILIPMIVIVLEPIGTYYLIQLWKLIRISSRGKTIPGKLIYYEKWHTGHSRGGPQYFSSQSMSLPIQADR